MRREFRFKGRNFLYHGSSRDKEVPIITLKPGVNLAIFLN